MTKEELLLLEVFTRYTHLHLQKYSDVDTKHETGAGTVGATTLPQPFFDQLNCPSLLFGLVHSQI